MISIIIYTVFRSKKGFTRSDSCADPTATYHIHSVFLLRLLLAISWRSLFIVEAADLVDSPPNHRG